jgi:hypothetical protein
MTKETEAKQVLEKIHTTIPTSTTINPEKR